MKRKRNPDADSPPASDAMLANLRPLREASSRLQAVFPRGRGPQKTPTKQLVSLRLSRDVIARYRSTGPGWQSRIDADLQKAAKRIRAER